MDDLKLFTSNEAANLLRVKPSTMYYWRNKGIGPKYARITRKIVYSLDDLVEFHEAKKQKEAQI